jgi:hypothetical protein
MEQSDAELDLHREDAIVAAITHRTFTTTKILTKTSVVTTHTPRTLLGHLQKHYLDEDRPATKERTS